MWYKTMYIKDILKDNNNRKNLAALANLAQILTLIPAAITVVLAIISTVAYLAERHALFLLTRLSLSPALLSAAFCFLVLIFIIPVVSSYYMALLHPKCTTARSVLKTKFLAFVVLLGGISSVVILLNKHFGVVGNWIIVIGIGFVSIGLDGLSGLWGCYQDSDGEKQDERTSVWRWGLYVFLRWFGSVVAFLVLWTWFQPVVAIAQQSAHFSKVYTSIVVVIFASPAMSTVGYWFGIIVLRKDIKLQERLVEFVLPILGVLFVIWVSLTPISFYVMRGLGVGGFKERLILKPASAIGPLLNGKLVSSENFRHGDITTIVCQIAQGRHSLYVAHIQSMFCSPFDSGHMGHGCRNVYRVPLRDILSVATIVEKSRSGHHKGGCQAGKV